MGGALVPLVAVAASVGGSMLKGSMDRRAAEKSQKKAMQQWQSTAYPNKASVDAAAVQNRGQLGQARLGSYQNLASNMAARGFGSGSGLIAEGAGGIEKGWLQALGRSGTELNKFANTPMWGPPSGAYSSPMSGAMSAGIGQGGGLLDQYLGYYMINKMFPGGFGGGTTHNYYG